MPAIYGGSDGWENESTVFIKSIFVASLRSVTFCLDVKSNQKDQGCGDSSMAIGMVFWQGLEVQPWQDSTHKV